ncbi:hypothetical protein [Priestia taiwanensis]|uniref:UDP-glucose 4-epimerase n=1 Tax=Priestia taiwanensis TaxID=1347902 RepID=A0A917ATW5_9BACI|nr:hypothetical protein [Priestia taiwanensis]MBM7364175.1 nucleoside-diphosphate-sugar epimerase [Priestia taiwanensis]GGE72236.1 UDP-glucose 4-epimerase [Priestia taiwanensis]
MKAAYVLGAFSFIGYAIVEELLRRDIQVYGYHPSTKLTPMEEEKWLLIGRNANFEYVDSLEEMKEVDVTYCCLYEPSKPLEECELASIKKVIEQHVSGRTVVVSTMLTEKKEFVHFRELEAYVQQEIESYTIIKVPTVYGPWQPAYMTYHRLLEGHPVSDALYPLEVDTDVLYIDDLAVAIVTLQEEGSFYFASVHENEWEAGIRILCEEPFVHTQSPKQDVKQIEKRTIARSLSIKEGLQRQREHINKFQDVFKE